MEEDEYKYLVNPFNIVDVVDSGVHRSHGPNDPETVTIFFSRNNLRELNTFSRMVLDDDILFTIPGYEILFNIIDHSNPDLPVYSIILEATDIDVSSAKSLREICSCDEYDALRGSYDGTKITAELNDDGTVTFSVPTLQGLRIREDAVPVFVSHADGPVKEAIPKYVININTLFGQFSYTGSFDGLIYECKLNDKTNEALSLLYKNKDSVLLVVSGYAPVYRAVKADLDSEKKKIKVYMSIYACYDNVRKNVTWLHSLEDLKAIGDESKVPWNAGMLTYKREDAMPKGITDVELRPNGEIYAKVNGKDEVEKLRKCLTDGYWDCFKDKNFFVFCGRGNGKPIFDPSNPEHRSIIMQGLREMMMPIEDKFPQLHRARLNKPKSI